MTTAEDDATWWVVVNARGQHALWKEGHPACPGWADTGVRGSKSVCLEEVKRRWTTLQPSEKARAKPAEVIEQPAFILWFTGLSGAGKSTLSKAVRERIAETRPAEVLDGDEVRSQLSAGLGFSKDDRDTNIRRIGFVARLLAKHGVVAITAAISPYAGVRDEIRALAALERVPFVEVWARAGLDALKKRDPKGLYQKALLGELKQFTGISDPYEEPRDADVVALTDQETVEQSVARIMGHLTGRGLVRA